MKKIKVGYLPFFIKLYDDDDAHYRDPLVEYMNGLIRYIEDCGIEVIVADEICRVKEEFDRAAEKFNRLEVDAVITQHLAYSPSLESIGALLSLKAPIVVFDTTVDYAFLSRAQEKNLMRANHGIHGVQDMCNMLTRSGRDYYLCVGHVRGGKVLDKLVETCKAAAMARNFKTAKIGSVGGSFEGMGDFAVEDTRYNREIGADVLHLTPDAAAKYLASVTEADVDAEIASDAAAYKNTIANTAAYREQTKNGLALRKWIADNGISAFSANFLNIVSSGLTAMPFVECCKQLAKGTGYAGEGDILTAGLVGTLASVYKDTTFVEMFCPDWEKDLIFFSHMGEMNPELAQWKPSLVDCPMGGNTGSDTVYVIGCCKPGKAVYVNLAPMKTGFRLILSDVEMLDAGCEDNIYNDSRNQGWMKPCMPVDAFLEQFSVLGGTHHSALVYGGSVETIAIFGRMMGFDVRII